MIRASLESVPKGQIEAANALGMTYFQALRRVILPEAIVVALPSLGNSFIGLIKGTSLAFVCAVVEMTAAGRSSQDVHTVTLKSMYLWRSFTG